MTLRAFAVALSLAVAAAILGQDSQPPKPQEQTDRPDAIRKLSKRERRHRVEKLAARHQEFAADVEPIMLPAELDMFLSLPDDTARDTFAEEFWRRRDHVNHTSGVFKDAYYRRLERAKELFKNVSTDRARLFPPARAAATSYAELQRVIQPVEIWKYPYLPGLGMTRVEFYKPRHQRIRLGVDRGTWPWTSSSSPRCGTHASQGHGARDALLQSSSHYAYLNQIQRGCNEAPNTAAITRWCRRTSISWS